MLRALRATALVVAVACAALLPLVALNLTHVGSFHLKRFRELTWILYGALLVYALARRGRAAFAQRWAGRLHAALDHPRFFPVLSRTMLGLYLLAAWTQHLSFHTFSHDFSMIDEALLPRPHRPLLFSPLLGRSFLSYHFSPILLPLVPIHAVIRTPYLLIALQPIALWSSGLVLRSILARVGVARTTANLACLVYFNHAIQIATLLYLFHMEAFLPLLAFAMVLFYLRGAWWMYAAATVLALAVKEEVGLYVAAFGLYAALVDRKRVVGLLTAAAGLAWTAFAIRVAIPAFGATGSGYSHLSRWSAWGDGMGSVIWGFVTHPIQFMGALLAWPYLKLFATLLFTPFLTRFGWLLFLVPWVIPATVGFAPHATLGLYYGIPLLAFSAIAGAFGLCSGAFRRLASPRFALGIACAAVVLNVSHLSYPEIPRARVRFLRELSAIPDTAAVQAMSCFYPVLGYAREKSLIESGTELTAGYAVLRTDGTPWPLGPGEAREIVDRALESGRYENRSSVENFYILRRTAGGAPRPPGDR